MIGYQTMRSADLGLPMSTKYSVGISGSWITIEINAMGVEKAIRIILSSNILLPIGILL